MAQSLAVGERRLPVFDTVADDSNLAFFFDVQNPTDEVSDDEETPMLTQPAYAGNSDDTFCADIPEKDTAEPITDTPFAVLPGNDYDGLFAEFAGSLLDELLTV